MLKRRTTKYFLILVILIGNQLFITGCGSGKGKAGQQAFKFLKSTGDDIWIYLKGGEQIKPKPPVPHPTFHGESIKPTPFLSRRIRDPQRKPISIPYTIPSTPWTPAFNQEAENKAVPSMLGSLENSRSIPIDRVRFSEDVKKEFKPILIYYEQTLYKETLAEARSQIKLISPQNGQANEETVRQISEEAANKNSEELGRTTGIIVRRTVGTTGTGYLIKTLNSDNSETKDPINTEQEKVYYTTQLLPQTTAAIKRSVVNKAINEILFFDRLTLSK